MSDLLTENWQAGDGSWRTGQPPSDWWQGRSGKWYPPSLANHPAARSELGDAVDTADDEPVEWSFSR